MSLAQTWQTQMQRYRMVLLVALGILGLTLSACNPELWDDDKHLQPLNTKIKARISEIDSKEKAPLLIRIFKDEAVLETWKQTSNGTYAFLKSYPICAFSGELGPKKKEGDRQAPEGFYAITPGQMNPKSNYYLSFNVGYPNKFDRAYGRTGGNVMVHGACSSRGCYAMQDEQIAEIYALGREAFKGGQRSFQVQIFPFRMTPENMATHANNPNFDFWQNIKKGYDHFEITKKPPHVEVCNKTYVFDPIGASNFRASAPCPDYRIDPSLAAALKKLRAKEAMLFRKDLAANQKEAKKQETKTKEEMIKSQLNVIKRKERIAEGKDPDGTLAGFIKGTSIRKAAREGSESLKTLVKTDKPSRPWQSGAIIPKEQPAQTEPATGQAPSASIASRLKWKLKYPFTLKKTEQPDQEETPTLTTLPEPRP